MHFPLWISGTYLLTTATSLLLAWVLWRANPQRGINQSAALMVFVCALWQQFSGFIYLHPESAAFYIRAVVALHGAGVACVVLLLRAMEQPSVRLPQLARTYWWIWPLVVGFAVPVFSPWFIPYESTPENQLRGVLWVLYGVVQVLGGLIVVGLTLRAALILKGSLRFTAQVICGSTGLVLILMGLRLSLRSALPEGFWPLSNAVFALILVAAVSYAVLSRRVFRARSVLLGAAFHVANFCLALAITFWVLRWGDGSEWSHYVAVIGAIMSWTGFNLWHRRNNAIRARDLAARLGARLQNLHRREQPAGGGLGDAMEEVVEWTGARNGMALVREGPHWRSQGVELRSDDPLAVQLEKHRWVTAESLARSWRQEEALLAAHSLERLGGVVAVMSSRSGGGPRVLLVLGDKAKGDYFTYQEIGTLQMVADALHALVESRDAGQRGRALGRIEAMELLGASIGHDFKQHLAAVRILAQLLSEPRVEKSELPLYRDKLNAELDQLGEFSRRLTKLGKSAPAAREQVRVKEVVDEVMVFLQESAERAQVFLGTDFQDESVRIWVDRSRLRQALVNLGLNAIEAMAGADIDPVVRELRIHVERDGSALTIVVADRGPGLPAEVLARLFDPFVTQGKSQGDGLGLYLSWDAITREGGFIRYEPNQPNGTRFILTLPD